MAGLGTKRKATYALDNSAKRFRIETISTYDNGLKNASREDTDDSSDSLNSDSNEDSDDIQSQAADTPLTSTSSPYKFPSDYKIIKCTYPGCTKTFNRPARLEVHLRSHTNERPFACTYPNCDKTYMCNKHLQQHIKGSHTHEKRYKCDWDGCDKSFLTSTRLRRHQESYRGHQGRDRFSCTDYPPCNQTFRKHQTLQQHIRADHLNASPFPCIFIDSITQAVCNMGFDSSTALRKHEDRFHGALRYWCDECATLRASNGEGSPQVGFRTQNELTKHIRTEHSNCVFCDTKFTSQVQLQRHIETEHARSVGIEPNNLNQPTIVSCTFPGCDKTYSKNYNLNVHIRTAHIGERFMCSASSTTSYGIKSPEVVVWTGIGACGRDFVSKANLEDHIRTQHLGLPSVPNAKKIKARTSTGKEARNVSKDSDDVDAVNLLTGIGYGQDDKRDIPCIFDDCPRLFMRQYDLEVHLQSAHSVSPSDPENRMLDMTGIPSGAGTYDSDENSALDDMSYQAELRSDMQVPLVGDDGSFENDTSVWFSDTYNSDTRTAKLWWDREEQEIRKLIDEGGGCGSSLDPALRDL